MKFRFRMKAFTATGLFLLIVTCQAMILLSATGTVAPENRAPFPQGKDSGTWKGNNLEVDYKYSRDQNYADMTGTVKFLDNLTMNFVLLRDFQLSAIFLDQNGRVLGTHGLTTGRGSFDPITFHIKISVPPAAESMSFSYRGTAIEGGSDGGGGGTTQFWQYPVN